MIVETEPYDPIGQFAPADPLSAGAPFGDPDPGRATGNELLTMQRIRVDVFLGGDFDDPDDAPPPLASRTTFVIDPTAFPPLAPTAPAVEVRP